MTTKTIHLIVSTLSMKQGKDIDKLTFAKMNCFYAIEDEKVLGNL